jgi:hypothetical protein
VRTQQQQQQATSCCHCQVKLQQRLVKARRWGLQMQRTLLLLPTA